MLWEKYNFEIKLKHKSEKSNWSKKEIQKRIKSFDSSFSIQKYN